MSKLLLYNDAGLCKINSSTGGVGWGWWWTIRFNPLFSLLIRACIYVRNQATWEKVLLHVRLDQVNS